MSVKIISYRPDNTSETYYSIKSKFTYDELLRDIYKYEIKKELKFKYDTHWIFIIECNNGIQFRCVVDDLNKLNI